MNKLIIFLLLLPLLPLFSQITEKPDELEKIYLESLQTKPENQYTQSIQEIDQPKIIIQEDRAALEAVDNTKTFIYVLAVIISIAVIFFVSSEMEYYKKNVVQRNNIYFRRE